jgi:Xaa-Pro dipeptidase
VKFVFSDGIGKALPAMKVASATAVTAGCRMVKTAHELALMRLASQVTFEAYEAAWKSLKAGMTQNEFAGLVSAAHSRLGFPGRRGRAGRREFRTAARLGDAASGARGTILLIDGGCAVEGFNPTSAGLSYWENRPTR